MLTLSYGFKKPQTGDKGSVWFPAMEDNMQKLNDHTHNGTDSAQLAGTSISTGSTAISSASWALTSGKTATYEQTVNMPAGFGYDSHYFIGFKNSANGMPLLLSYEKVSNTQVKVFINDNTLNVTMFVR